MGLVLRMRLLFLVPLRVLLRLRLGPGLVVVRSRYRRLVIIPWLILRLL